MRSGNERVKEELSIYNSNVYPFKKIYPFLLGIFIKTKAIEFVTSLCTCVEVDDYHDYYYNFLNTCKLITLSQFCAPQKKRNCLC